MLSCQNGSWRLLQRHDPRLPSAPLPSRFRTSSHASSAAVPHFPCDFPRTSSAAVPNFLRALLLHFFRTSSALLPQRFRTSSALLLHNCRNGGDPPSAQHNTHKHTREKQPLVQRTSGVMTASYVSVFLPAVQQLALSPLFRTVPKSAHSSPASQPTACPWRPA